LASSTKRSSARPRLRPGRGSAAHSQQRGRRLRESSAQFRLAQEALGFVTWIWDVRDDRVQWYGDMSRLLGLAPGSFSGRFEDYLTFVHPEDVAGARATFLDCLKGKRPEYRAVERVVWPDGSVHWLETYGRAEYGADGRAVRAAGAIKDISERKRMESARLRAEQQLARVFDASPDYIAIVRASDGRFVAANRAFEQVTGYRADEVVGRTVAEIGIWAIPGERERFLADLHKGVAVRDRPMLLRVQGGRIVSGTISASLIEHDGEQLIIGMVHDITEAKRLERRARQSEHKFAALFENSPEAITLYRLSDGMRLEANSAWERTTGYSRAQAKGRPAKEMGLWKDQAQRAAVIARIDTEGSVSNVEARLVRADGSELDALISAVRIDLEGEACVLWCWRDVSAERAVERRAQQSERKFAAMFETSPVGLVVTRPRDRRIVEINDAALQLIGLGRDEAIGAMTTDVVEILDQEQFQRIRSRGLAGERVAGEPLRFRRRDGKQVEALISGATVEFDGEPHFVVSLLDVTEQRRVERERQQADARYRALFESTSDSIAIFSPDWRFIDLNAGNRRLSGYAREELIGQPVTMVLDQEDLAQKPIRDDRDWTLIERTLRRKDGSKRAIEVMSGRLPDGNIIVIARDISERKRSETLLMNVARGVSAELGEAFFRSLVEHLARELDADFAFIAEVVQPDNERCRTLAYVADGAIAPNFEYPLAGSPCLNAITQRGTVMYPQGVAQQFPLDAGLGRNGIEGYVGTSLHGADGTALGVLVVMHRKPIERSQFWASMIEIFGARAAAEIERSRAEALVRRTNASLEQVVHERTSQLEEANRDLESYNYSISHDLRQPLNAIAGFAELVRDTAGSALQSGTREFVREIESNAERMERMIEALLQLSRAGRGPLDKAEVQMGPLVEAVLRDLGVGAPLAAQIEVGELPAAQGDEVLLRQVWANLIGNALKYSRLSRAPRIRISGARRDGFVEYEISDNGVGFDMLHAERLCETFHRLPSAVSFEGNGVGLAIVQRVLRRHGGSIRAESAPGAGATFRFTLPDEALA